MIVYHGSYTEIVNIDLSRTTPNKDFGRGFYVTKVRGQAEKWAARKGEKYGNTGAVSGFKFNENAFFDSAYKTLRFSGYTDEWFDFVVANRNNESASPAHDYDIVEGPVADDYISSRISRYLRGGISREAFFDGLTQYPDSHQICFCTSRSLCEIERVNLLALCDIEDIGKSIITALVNDYGLPELESEDLYFTSDTYANLSDENTGLYKKSWQEVYEMVKNEKLEGVVPVMPMTMDGTVPLIKSNNKIK
jgi:hypothetical protein